MKTKLSCVLGIAILLICTKLNAQSEQFTDFNLDKKEITSGDFITLDTESILEDFRTQLENRLELSEKFNEQVSPNDIVFAMQMLGVGAGLGLGEDETLWCLQAAYYYRLKLFQRSALYGSLGIDYNGASIGDQTQNLFGFQLGLMMFQTISALNEVRLIYGLLGGYGFGSEKFNGFTTDITRINVALVAGFQLMLAARWSLAIQTNIVAHNRWTYKPESGGEFKNDFTNFFFNKNNLLTLSLIFHLKKRQ
ncbi:hypothetical protein [Winogradskyella sp. MH6]|uniref:hypothetical protein n=1 Tax=Winogradskyella sp. MH6 TaxID=2929510 RepID=UPI001FB303C0|nr:hypothetical protein [Winogradskyella sp. MH6]